MIETERLRLTPMGLEDAPFVFELLNTKEWLENIGQRNVHSVEDAAKYIQDKMIDHYTINGYGNYLMTRKSDNAKMGCISLYNREDVDGVDIGFAMLPEYMKMGYAYEGAQRIKEYAQHPLNLSGITAFTSKTNVGSQRLIEKLGLEFKKTILFGEEKEELLFYELLF
ncbi:MAG: GNAT family N-acetyltransferase [Saprospiraceae bacterium]|nr:GNAT family N-acetyltransferase [Saprospiraceae bacterium]